jgi:isopenicillin-N epimerase
MQTAAAARDTEWANVRAAFELSPDYIHLGAGQFLASHPQPVREAIERHRRALDANPVLYIEHNEDRLMERVRACAIRALGVSDPNEVALTDSTTMGLALMYAGLPSRQGDEIVTTDHEHYSQLEALRGAQHRSGVWIKKVRLYDGSAADARAGELVTRVLDAITDATRAVAITWVHSDTGLKFPVAQLADALRGMNAGRDPDHRIRLCVDGAHGFGIETDTMPMLGADFMSAGTHKWIYGPRGTGLLWAPIKEWRRMIRVIPSFTEMMDAYSEGGPLPEMDGRQFTPGGFHSVEHRWAAAEAFEYREQIGPAVIRDRIYALNRRCREGLRQMPHVTLHTPLATELSAGITAFEIKGLDPEQARQRLLDERIIATVAPYQTKYLRLTPAIFNTEEEIDRALEVIRRLTRG